MANERVLGVDYVILKGEGGREYINGAIVEGDANMHLGSLSSRQTVCGKGYTRFLVTYSDVEITCGDCIKKIKEPSHDPA